MSAIDLAYLDEMDWLGPPDVSFCIFCGERLSDTLHRLGSTSCLDCPPTTHYPMRFTHP